MMLRKSTGILLGMVLVVVIGVTVLADSKGWRLPFNGVAKITLGPGEVTHIQTSGNDSSEAIDYSMTVGSFSVVSPADGTVIDYLTAGTGTFGNLLRINHPNSGSCSFFAHLSNANVTTGGVVQGQTVGSSGNSGIPGQGVHLHFEGRNNCVAGQPFSGNAVSIKALPGIWWRSSYEPTYAPAAHDPTAPPIPTTNLTPIGGSAAYPPPEAQPTFLPSTVTARLLSNRQSPPNNPEGWITNLIDGNPGNATLFFAGSPSVVANTPVSPYRPSFRLLKWATDCVPSPTIQCYDLVIDTVRLKKREAISPSNESFTTNHQHTYALYSKNSIYGFSNIAYFYEFYAGDSSANPPTPYLAITLNENQAGTVLEYCANGADQYQVMEAHGGPTTVLYQGSACSIKTTRTVGGTNKYSVRAHFPTGWSAVTPFVNLHY